MRTSTFNYIKDILADYSKIDDYIKQREKELRNPFQERDQNARIKGNKINYDTTANLLITIEQDRRLASLARNKRIIADTINAADEETKTIIKELYLKKYPQYNIQGLIDHQLIFCSRSQAYNLRNKFFGDIAIQLNLEI